MVVLKTPVIPRREWYPSLWETLVCPPEGVVFEVVESFIRSPPGGSGFRGCRVVRKQGMYQDNVRDKE